MFRRVLIANRGEIARRIIRACRTLGVETVAVYSEADATAPFVAEADQAVLLGPAPARESYLLGDRVIAAALATGAEAIHPGYGFLSENAGFARACAAAGIVFIGPRPESIAAIGDKASARAVAEKAGVAPVPGFRGTGDDASFAAAAATVGFPLLVKAAAGGGGKGMRVVRNAAELLPALAASRREARAAFGDDTMIIERYLWGARHVEVQILADRHGHTIAVLERDCTLQRRHQKVIEQCPSPAVTPEIRARMQDAAVRLARAVGYESAGTAEFLLARDGSFHFLEMNTRLQVEHPVTEMVAGIDLVVWQLRIAAGEPLTIKQEDIVPRGHAIEARLYAEDAWHGFLPQAGHLVDVAWPSGPGVRVDAGVRAGQTITADYDPMLAKICAHGATFDEARLRLIAALRDTVVLGPTVNTSFLIALLEHQAFITSADDTTWIERALAGGVLKEPALPADAWLLAAAAFAGLIGGAGAAPSAGAPGAALAPDAGPWAPGSGWRVVPGAGPGGDA